MSRRYTVLAFGGFLMFSAPFSNAQIVDEPPPTGTIVTRPYWRGSVLAGRPTAEFDLSQPLIDFVLSGVAAGESETRTFVHTGGIEPDALFPVNNVSTCLPEHPCLAGQTMPLSIPMWVWVGTATHDPELRYRGIQGIWEPLETFDSSAVRYASSLAFAGFDGLVTFPGRPTGKDQSKVTFRVPVTLRLDIRIIENYLPPGTPLCSSFCDNTDPRQRHVRWETPASLEASVNANYNSALKRWEYTIDENHVQTYALPASASLKNPPYAGPCGK